MSNPVHGFGLDYAGQLIYCEVVMHDLHYEVMFNGKSVATVQHTDNFDWIQASGVILPQSIIDEIGSRVESKYE